MDKKQRYMKVIEAQKYVGCAYNTLMKFVEKGLPIINLGTTKLFDKNDIDKFMSEHKK